MNGQPLFQFQTHQKHHIQNTEARRPAPELVRSTIADSQIQSTDPRQMSSQRTSSVKLQQQEGDHMLVLHSRLHQEADKIRKWKIQTELDLKDKVKKLTEANSQIDIMKKSLLDLQLENERTSARLQEEIEGREDMLRRINGTREMCSLLQAHSSKVDDRLTQCETERTELKYVGKENMQRIEEVTKQLHDLQLAASESKKKIQSQTNAERNDRMQAEKVMKTKIDAAEHEETEINAAQHQNFTMQRLKDKLKEKDTDLCKLLVTLQEREDSLQTVEKSKDELQMKVSSLHEDLVNREEQLKESSLRISAVQDDKYRLEKLLKGLEHEFNSLQIAKDSITLDMTEAAKRLDEQLQKAKQDAESTRILLEEERNKLKICKDKLAETSALMENLKNSKDSLMMEKTDIEMQLDLEKLQLNNLLTEKTEDKDEIHKLTGEICMLKKKLEKESLCRIQARDEVETLHLQMKTCMLERDDHVEEIMHMKDELFAKQEKIKSLESLLSEEEHKNMKLQSDIDKVEGRVASDREQLQQAVEQVEELKQEIHKKDAGIQLKEQEFEKLTNDLQSLRWEKEETEKKLSATTSELEYFRSELSKQNCRIKDLNSQLNSTTEQSKESVKCLTTKLEKEKETVKERDSQLQTLQRELENVKKMNENLVMSLQFCKEEMNKVKEVCQREQETATLAIKKAEAMQESAQKERQNAIALTDCQLAEMMATLDTYKQNNERLISEKDAEIKALTAKLQNTESLAVQFEKELLKEKKEIEHLKNQIALKTKEKIHQSPMMTTVVPLTDKVSPRTPVAVTPMKTPQSGILRASNFISVSKRRKVAFLSNDCSLPSSSEESDLMELNTEIALSNKASTPLLHKFSPKVRSNDIPSTPAFKATPRRMPSCRISTEVSERQMISDVKTSNLRKTPAKKMSKVFITSPRNKTPSSKTKIKEKTKGSQMSWFELDSVYGFGPED